MNLNPLKINKSTQIPSPEEVLKDTEYVASLKFKDGERRTGWTYFSYEYGLKAAQIILKLHASTSKQALINTAQLSDQPGTIRSRIVQGKAYIIDKGVECFASKFEPDELEIIKQGAPMLELSLRRSNILIRLKSVMADFMDALTIVDAPADEEPYAPFNEEVFRVELLNFVNTAPEDTQLPFRDLPSSAIKYAKTVAAQDNSIIIEQFERTLVVMKLSPEAVAQLNAP